MLANFGIGTLGLKISCGLLCTGRLPHLWLSQQRSQPLDAPGFVFAGEKSGAKPRARLPQWVIFDRSSQSCPPVYVCFALKADLRPAAAPA
jgi:hypothetical protein